MAKSLVTANVIGVNLADDLFEKLADDGEGRRWKKAAMFKAGKKAFQPVVLKARKNAPFGSNNTGEKAKTKGLTRRSIVSKNVWNNKPKLTARGSIQRSRYSVYTTLSPRFEKLAPKYKLNPKGESGRIGKAIRYPFMNEVGVPPQTYLRTKPNGHAIIKVKRGAPRRPLLFQNKALSSEGDRAVNAFVTDVENYVELYAQKIGKENLAQVLRRTK